MATTLAVELAAQCNEVSRNLSIAIQQVHKLRAEWDESNDEEDKPQDPGVCKRSSMIQQNNQQYLCRLVIKE